MNTPSLQDIRERRIAAMKQGAGRKLEATALANVIGQVQNLATQARNPHWRQRSPS